jgi:hypothetical protein
MIFSVLVQCTQVLSGKKATMNDWKLGKVNRILYRWKF